MTEPDYVDVIIVGAGIAGIGAGCHLQDQCPGHSYLIFEGRNSIGGTWDLFRYPGVRSDSDMYTLGYRFKPWKGSRSIVDGASILAYIKETAAENGVDKKIRFWHQVKSASWSSEKRCWTVLVLRKDTKEILSFSCGFLFVCSGYYNYNHGHTPKFPGMPTFQGQIVHAQQWPKSLDLAGKRIVVIGSGATAMSLAPALADKASHVTLLQRSPTYVVAMPDTDVVAKIFGCLLPEQQAYALIRWKNIKLMEFIYKQSRKRPALIRKVILNRARRALGSGFDVNTHFSPRYDPWDQRLCLIPNNDLFSALREGKASIVTDSIERFTATGIRLQSRAELDADLVVMATGLNILALGDIAFAIDGEPVDFSKRWIYKGLAYSDVPNMVSIFGYINASWTLRVDLICAYVCRLLNHMRTQGASVCVPRLRPTDYGMVPRPLIDSFSPGYMQRALPMLPRQGDREPWTNPQSYGLDKKALTQTPIDDGVMTFSFEHAEG